jgi:hypothetical protein
MQLIRLLRIVGEGRKSMPLNLRSKSVVLLSLLMFLLLGALVQGALAAGIGKDGTIAAQKGKATTLQELIAMYDSSSCIECHQEIHDDWAESAHSRSVYGTGRTAATFRTAFTNGFMSWTYSGVDKPEDVEVEHLMGCAKCHLPQLADATDAVAKELVTTVFDWMDAYKRDDMATFETHKENLLKLNINCLVCHNRMAITHKWADGYPQDGVVYGSSDGAHDDADFPVVKVSPIMSESILCGQCHGLGPNLELDNPTQCATAYGSYLWAYVAGGGSQTCQECHMQESGLGHNMQSYRDPGMAKRAIDFHVETRPMNWRDGTTVTPKVMVDVSMTNRAGHAIPDG